MPQGSPHFFRLSKKKKRATKRGQKGRNINETAIKYVSMD
jgi:hypothetical protein